MDSINPDIQLKKDIITGTVFLLNASQITIRLHKAQNLIQATQLRMKILQQTPTHKS